MDNIPSPEDFALIKALGADLFKQAAQLDSNVMQTASGLGRDAAMQLRNDLLVTEQLVKQNAHVHQQAHAPHFPQPAPHFPQPAYDPAPIYNPPYIGNPVPPVQPVQMPPLHRNLDVHVEASDQLEFNLNPPLQEITNNLLKEISKKLTKVIDLLQSEKDVKRLNVSKDGVPKTPFKPKQTE